MSMPAAAPRRAFPCTGCGACCKQVHLAPETRYLDRGDGACRHFDDAAKSCTIYAQRPAVCRVDSYYDAHYAGLLDWEAFIALNLAACARLLAMEGEDGVPEPARK